MKKGSRFALGAAIGAVAGVVAGLLAAPKSGKETRADIKQKALEMKKEAAEKAGDLKK
ncbi:MAG: YtxH domain-containing protein, partial [Candidatus Chaera renei]